MCMCTLNTITKMVDKYYILIKFFFVLDDSELFSLTTNADTLDVSLRNGQISDSDLDGRSVLLSTIIAFQGSIQIDVASIVISISNAEMSASLNPTFVKSIFKGSFNEIMSFSMEPITLNETTYTTDVAYELSGGIFETLCE